LTQAGGSGGTHGGMIALQPCSLNVLHWAFSTFAFAASTAATPAFRTGWEQKLKQLAANAVSMQSESEEQVRFDEIADSTSARADAARLLHDEELEEPVEVPLFASPLAAPPQEVAPASESTERRAKKERSLGMVGGTRVPPVRKMG
jgi:hypothetical protein